MENRLFSYYIMELMKQGKNTHFFVIPHEKQEYQGILHGNQRFRQENHRCFRLFSSYNR